MYSTVESRTVTTVTKQFYLYSDWNEKSNFEGNIIDLPTYLDRQIVSQDSIFNIIECK